MNRYCKLALATALSLATLACSSEQAPETSGAKAPDYRKPGAPIALLTQDARRSEIGDELEVDLSLKSRPGQLLTLQLLPDAGLELIAPQGPSQLTPDEAGVVSLTATVRTPVAGRHYLGISATSGNADSGQSRSFSIAFQVGAEAASTKALASEPGQEHIRRMPAEESTH